MLSKLQKEFCCKYCGTSFVKDEDAKAHIEKCKEKETPTCNYCGKTFSSQKTLKEHKKSHFEENAYSCDICNKELVSRKAMNDHKLHVHSTVKNCLFCPDRYKVGEIDLFI